VAKKKSKRNSRSPSLVATRMDEIGAINGAAHRVNTVIQKMTAAPETVLEHLARIGITPIIDQMVLDDGEPKVYVLFGYEDLLKNELHNITSGGAFKDSYPPGTKTSAPKNPTAPIVLDEIRRRMAQVAESVSDQVQSDQRPPSDQRVSDSGDTDDEWPVTGESPI